jgi:SAM-dependent methyltransferase
VSDGFYTSGEYLARNPTWHAEDSAWKASQVLGMLNRHGLRPRTVCEIGCGAGAVLRELHDRMDHQPSFVGYEVSPQAFKLAVSRSSERLTFRLGDVLKDDDRFDLTLLMTSSSTSRTTSRCCAGCEPARVTPCSTYRSSSRCFRCCSTLP